MELGDFAKRLAIVAGRNQLEVLWDVREMGRRIPYIFSGPLQCCNPTVVCVMAFICLMTQLVSLGVNIEKMRRICLLATYTACSLEGTTGLGRRNHCLCLMGYLQPPTL